AHLARVGLHHGVAERYLTIAGNGDTAVAADGKDRGGVEHVGVLARVHAISCGRTLWMGVASRARKGRRDGTGLRRFHAAPQRAALPAYWRRRGGPTACVWRAGARRRRPWPGAGNPGGCRSGWWRCRRGQAAPAPRAGRRRTPGCGW